MVYSRFLLDFVSYINAVAYLDIRINVSNMYSKDTNTPSNTISTQLNLTEQRTYS